jgi:hypothetical protein
LYEVQQVLGHSDPAVTMRYAHLSTKTMLEASSAASMVIERAIKAGQVASGMMVIPRASAGRPEAPGAAMASERATPESLPPGPLVPPPATGASSAASAPMTSDAPEPAGRLTAIDLAPRADHVPLKLTRDSTHPSLPATGAMEPLNASLKADDEGEVKRAA